MESSLSAHINTAYRGATDRWRAYPGGNERHLQRMEGNPLFIPAHLVISDDEIAVARERDDFEALQLSDDVAALFSEITAMGNQVSSVVLIDIAQYRLEPLMIRAAVLGEHPEATRLLLALKNVGETIIQTLDVSEEDRVERRRIWRALTNPIRAQFFSKNFPVTPANLASVILCETTDGVEEVLDIFCESNSYAELLKPLAGQATALFKLAAIDNFHVPDENHKRDLFAKLTYSNGSPRPKFWWKQWLSRPGEDQE